MLIRKVSLREVKNKWERMYASNHALTPYSSYSFNEIVQHYYRFGLKRALFRTKIFEILDDSQNTIMIIPLYGKGRRFYILGDLIPTGHLDFIYKTEANNEEFEQAFKLLQTELRGTKVVFNKISQRSKLNDYLALHYPALQKNVCVNINFGTDYEAYLGSLSKSTRNNIHTMYNRIKRDISSWELEVMMRTPVPRSLEDEIIRLYTQKIFDKNEVRAGWLLRTSWRYTNPITISTMRMEDNFNSILRFNGNIVAAFCGYVDNDESTIITPRGAMDRTYSRYSPGIVVILETIKWLTRNTKITNLDLSRGDEAYKYTLGGKEHYNYSYEIDL
jgi:hypothetical protein